jgi:hypothetical protein
MLRRVMMAMFLTAGTVQTSQADSIFVVDKRYEGEYFCRYNAATSLQPRAAGEGWESVAVQPSFKETIISVQAAGLFSHTAPSGESIPAMYYVVTVRSPTNEYAEACKSYDEPRSSVAPEGSIRFVGNVGGYELRFFECSISSGTMRISMKFDRYMRYSMRGYFDRGEYNGVPFIEVGTCSRKG